MGLTNDKIFFLVGGGVGTNLKGAKRGGGESVPVIPWPAFTIRGKENQKEGTGTKVTEGGHPHPNKKNCGKDGGEGGLAPKKGTPCSDCEGK